MKRFVNILLVVDAGGKHSAALSHAVALAKQNRAALTLVDFVDSVPAELRMAITAVTPEELCDIAAGEKLDRIRRIARAVDKGDVSIETKVLVGKPFIEIIRQVLREEHDLVVKCADAGDRLGSKLFGSTDMRLMRKCPCPVWIVNSTQHSDDLVILAAVDQGSNETVKDVLNREILEVATSLAIAKSSALHVVHALDIGDESYSKSPHTRVGDDALAAVVAKIASERKSWLENLVETYGGEYDMDTIDRQLHVIEGDARQVIPTTARELNVDVIVMGTIARIGIPEFFMGNTAECILHQLDCSVLTVKPPGFISPVTLEA